MAKPVVIGTRGSRLALWQAEWVRAALAQRFPGTDFELAIIKTEGDKILDVPLAKVGGKGLFVKEIEEALLHGRADLAVHSMKDMPSEIPAALAIGAVPEREIPADVLISRNGLVLKELPAGGVVGTSSLRRAAQLRHLRPDLEVVPLRGNVETRLRKLDTERLAAVVLAAAGVKRLGLEQRVSEYLDHEAMLPAVGQGALCIEIREEDARIGPMVAALEDPATRTVVSGERAFLKRLQGGCQVPIAGHGRLDGAQFTLTGLVADLDGGTVIKHRLSGPAAAAERIGIELAETLLGRGADAILKKLTDAAL
ncbi:MAG TPA: hydroxymethylbilane synthase [Desulfobacterales bacterium]|nr:hydroxymethylbilane synthase [Desulfobacterales bacterium]